METAKTKLMMSENVVTGSIHEEATRCFERNNLMDVKVVFTSPCDSGYGAMRRFRGWTGAQFIMYSRMRVLCFLYFHVLHSRCGIVELPLDSPVLRQRTIALRRDAGRWLGDPQVAYDKMRLALRDRQVHIEDMFWMEDPKMCLA